MKHIGIFLIVLCISLGYIMPASAQSSVLPFGSGTSIGFDVTPSQPEPNEEITVAVSSYSIDLGRSSIAWVINGTQVAKEVGLKTIKTKVGSAGSSTKIAIIISNTDGSTISKELVIIPNEVDLLMEAQTSVPPFYKGKKIATHQSTYTFIAIPNIFYSQNQKVPANEIYYTWEINGTIDGANSGLGKDTYEYTGKLISRPLNVSVEAKTSKQDIVAIKKKTFTPGDPIVLFYEKDPSLGMLLHRTLGSSFTLEKQEIEVVAQPFFFDNNDVKQLVFEWSTPQGKIENTNNSVQFRRVDKRAGDITVITKITNPNKLLQYVSGQLHIQYFENNSFTF